MDGERTNPRPAIRRSRRSDWRRRSSGQAWNSAVVTGIDYLNQTLQEMGLADKIKVSLSGSEDSQGDATAGIEAAKKLADVDKVNIVIGDLYSSVTIAAFQSVFLPDNS